MFQLQPAMLTGPHLRLRLIEPKDAAYVHALRTDPAYNTHLSSVQGTVADQADWLWRYKTREADGGELYFVIERLDGLSCGLVRLYDFRPDSFTWGSWILDHNKPPKAALESAFLIYRTAFLSLKLERAEFEVRRGNEHTLAFHRRFGCEETGQSEENVYFTYTRAMFQRDQQKLSDILEGNDAT